MTATCVSNLTARSCGIVASSFTPSTRRLLDGVAMPVPRRSTEPGRPRVHPTHWLIYAQTATASRRAAGSSTRRRRWFGSRFLCHRLPPRPCGAAARRGARSARAALVPQQCTRDASSSWCGKKGRSLQRLLLRDQVRDPSSKCVVKLGVWRRTGGAQVSDKEPPAGGTGFSRFFWTNDAPRASIPRARRRVDGPSGSSFWESKHFAEGILAQHCIGAARRLVHR